MGEKATDNAYVERVNGTIKNEFLEHWEINNLEDLQAQLKNAVNYYNCTRLHKSLPGRVSPADFEHNLVHLKNQKRPMVTVYANGKPKMTEASSLWNLGPEKGLPVHVCPITINYDSLTKNGQP